MSTPPGAPTRVGMGSMGGLATGTGAFNAPSSQPPPRTDPVTETKTAPPPPSPPPVDDDVQNDDVQDDDVDVDKPEEKPSPPSTKPKNTRKPAPKKTTKNTSDDDGVARINLQLLSEHAEELSDAYLAFIQQLDKTQLRKIGGVPDKHPFVVALVRLGIRALDEAKYAKLFPDLLPENRRRKQ